MAAWYNKAMFQALRHSPHLWLITIICLLVVLHLAILPFSPPGFYVDEAATGAHVQAMLHHGTNAHGVSWPLFSESLGGGYTTPTYLYPLAAWGALFGTNELAIRYFSQVTTLLAVGILAWSLRYWLSKKAMLIAAAVGLALPWGWLQGSLAWDPALVPLFVSIAFCSFTLLLFSRNRRARIAATLALPAFLVGLAYLYPPCRLSAPLLYMLLYGVLLCKKAVSWRHVILSSVGAALLAIPLALFMFEPAALGRSGAVSVFYDSSLVGGLLHATGNLLALLNPLFLFGTGDPNLRHSTGIQGMLGVAALLPVGALAFTSYKAFRRSSSMLLNRPLPLLATVSAGAIIISYLGSAFTGEGQPHSLRATAAWPFFVILITLGWLALRRYSQRLFMSAVAVAAIATLAYAVDLAFLYPSRAASSFDVDIRSTLKNDQSDYPELARKYYQDR